MKVTVLLGVLLLSGCSLFEAPPNPLQTCAADCYQNAQKSACVGMLQQDGGFMHLCSGMIAREKKGK